MEQDIKITIITPSFNVESTLKDTLNSVDSQTYKNIEHLIIDGNSTDNTLEVFKANKNLKSMIISEPDNGLYDAINKGILMASGEVIGILNADDVFHDENVISKIMEQFVTNKNLDAMYGNIIFTKKLDLSKIVRFYKANKWNPNRFAWGFMPPHPSFFCKKELFNSFGLYKLDYKIAADYELLIRFIYVNKIKVKYLSMTTTIMRIGGISTNGIKSNIILNSEILKACKANNLYSNYLMIYSKYFFKIFDLLVFIKR